MNREKIWLQGDLADTPFPGLLLLIYKSQGTGCLQVKTKKIEKNIEFKNGDICTIPDSINKNKFGEFLIDKNLISASINELCKKKAKNSNSAYVQALHEQNTLLTEELWKAIYTFTNESLFYLFDTTEAKYLFNSNHTFEAEQILFTIPTLNIILDGIRQMQNFDIIEAKMPKPDKILRLLTPDYKNQIKLNSPEKYISHFIASQNKMKYILEKSSLGKSMTKRLIFLFLSLGLVSSSEKPLKKHHVNKLSQAKLHKIQETFNSKCSYIYKYLSKEIGPAAFNVLEKCLEDAKPYMSQYSKDLRLNNEGNFKLRSPKKSNLSHLEKDFQQMILKDFNELLAAEILAVKKTLGNKHESVLVKNLEKIGI